MFSIIAAVLFFFALGMLALAFVVSFFTKDKPAIEFTSFFAVILLAAAVAKFLSLKL